MAGADSCLQAGFAGAKFDRAMMSLGVGEDGASWAVDGIRRRRMHRPRGPAFTRSESAGPQRPRRFAVGDRVEGLYHTGSWYPAVIESQNGDGSFTLQWSDGDSKDRVKTADQLRFPREPAAEPRDPEADESFTSTDAGGSAAAGGDDDGAEAAEWGGQWRQGDVVGLACDLSTGNMLVSVNGEFAPPNGVAFAEGVRPGPAAGASLFPALSGRGVKVLLNFGADPIGRPFAGPRWPDAAGSMLVVRGDPAHAEIDAALAEVAFGDTTSVVGSPQLAATGGRVYFEVQLLEVPPPPPSQARTPNLARPSVCLAGAFPIELPAAIARGALHLVLHTEAQQLIPTVNIQP